MWIICKILNQNLGTVYDVTLLYNEPCWLISYLDFMLSASVDSGNITELCIPR